jgi:hypothetical protein
MTAQISRLRAYVRHLKPGDKVTFNPQPDPPGDPDPWFRRASEAYQSLQQELSDLSKNSAGRCEAKTPSCRGAIDDAQAKFDRLGQVSDRASAKTALTSLSSSVQRLSRVL